MRTTKLIFTILFALTIGFNTTSCESKDDKEMIFYQEQPRDPALLGVWKVQTTEKSSTFYMAFRANGRYELLSNELELYGRRTFYYTQGNKILLFTPGSGIKVSSSKSEMTYQIKDDLLTITSHGEKTTLKKVVEIKK